MASFIPLIQDILPIFLPSSIHIAKAEEILPPSPNPAEPTEAVETIAISPGPRVISRDAIVNKTDKMCATVLVAKPKSSSAIHHHGEQGLSPVSSSSFKVLEGRKLATGQQCTQSDTVTWTDAIIYAASGSGILATGPSNDGLEPKRHELAKGDFAFIPAWTEHQALNESETDDLMWVVIRTGPSPVEVNLTGWEGPEAKSWYQR